MALQAVVDASGVGYGGILTAHSSAPVRFQGTFSREQAAGSGRYWATLEPWSWQPKLALTNFPGPASASRRTTRVLYRVSTTSVAQCKISTTPFGGCSRSVLSFTATYWRSGSLEILSIRRTPCPGSRMLLTGASHPSYIPRRVNGLESSRRSTCLHPTPIITPQFLSAGSYDWVCWRRRLQPQLGRVSARGYGMGFSSRTSG